MFLVNGKSVSVTVGSFDRTDQVLERVCSEIQLASELTYYFSLFLEKQCADAESWTGEHAPASTCASTEQLPCCSESPTH